MPRKLSTRQRVICGILVAATAILYLFGCLCSIRSAWQRKEGDLPPAPSWIQQTSLFLVAYPAALLPGSNGVLAVPLVNALLWGGLAGSIYVWRVHRRTA